ncbi:MAG TPA: MFS transporter [Gammaproteobacteria bacterium]|nr:MFS transporter [Gammaproteobacteria bacterium]
MTAACIDEENVKSFHWRIIFTAGMGFFTDAYDLFIIGVVTTLLRPLWHLTTWQLATLNGASLAAAAFGAIIFGTLSDKLGRKKMYGIEVAILFTGAILSSLAPSFWFLLAARIVVGFGIGGDYPSSAVIASEHSHRKNRGFLVLLVFAMQAIGLIVGPLFASLLLYLHIPYELVWRILLAAGAIPAASVFYLRRRIQETPHYLLTQSIPREVSRVIADLTDTSKRYEQLTFLKQSFLTKRWLTCLFGTASAWFLLDVAFYGNSVSAVLLLKALNPSGHLLFSTLVPAVIFLLCALPGYVLAAYFIDHLGRKFLQSLGFVMMGTAYLIISMIPHPTEHIPLFLAVFGMSFFFVNFGPNTTTFLIPSEIFPANLRAKGHGISAAVGKLGAFVGVFLLPPILERHGLSTIFHLLAIVSFTGVLVTQLIPEMAGVGLESSEILKVTPEPP